MTSVILPPLKRTLTDIVDEELYFANSPTPVLDSPKLNATTLFNFAPVSPAHESSKIFNDYSNPEQSFIQPSQLMKQMPRRRMTTLSTEMTEKPISEDDYFLFNPDIKPSSFINFNDNILDSSVYVPKEQSSNIMDDLNNYLNADNDYLTNEFEDMDDVSDDEDDNYFNDNTDFDQWMDENNDPNDQFFNSNDSSLNVGGFIDDYGIKKIDAEPQPVNIQDIEQSPMDDDFMDDIEPLERDVSPVSLDEPEEPSDEEYHESKTEPKRKLQTAAEITALNPHHQCTLTNPSSGLPCNKQFSRPYDLIRHQETIHASKKKIFRCVICEGRQNGAKGNGKSKTFSRGDALSRHIKVKHGLVGAEALDIINEAKENVEYVSVNS